MPIIQANEVLQDLRQVSVFKVVAHTTGAYGNTSENHWCITLKLPTGMIRINMRAREYEDPTGVLEWSSHEFTVSNSEIRSWEYPAKRAVTVQEVARTVYQKGRQRYQMSGGGSGCRWWVATVMNDFALAGLVEEDTYNKVYPNLLFLYHKTNPAIPLHMVQGTFD